MSELQKITDAEMDAQGVCAAPDVLSGTAAENKAVFDRMVRSLVAGVFNADMDVIAAWFARTDNPHGVAKAQVGLGACDDTADADKPVSGPQGAALALKADQTAADGLQTQVTALDTAKADRANILEKDNAAPYTPTGDYHPATKKYTDDTMAAAVMGQVPDKSITAAKLADGAVTLEKLGEDVTPGNLGAAAAGHTHTPGSIGAAAAGHTHTPGSIGAAAAGHTHTAAQVGAYTKAETLTDATKAMMGLAAGATPDAAFALIGKQNQHLWRRRTVTYTIKKDSPTLLTLTDSSDPSGTIAPSYSKTVGFQENGMLKLTGTISTVNISYGAYTNARVLNGAYFRRGESFYLGYSDPTCSVSGNKYSVSMYAEKATGVKTCGAFEYIRSSSRNAYPDSGESGGYQYEYLGVPFDRLREAAQIQTGSYIGTGTFGENSPNRLTCAFQPKLVIVTGARDAWSSIGGGLHPFNGGWLDSFIWTHGCTAMALQSSTETGTALFSLSGNVLSWSGISAALQCNSLNKTYYFTVIG